MPIGKIKYSCFGNNDHPLASYIHGNTITIKEKYNKERTFYEDTINKFIS